MAIGLPSITITFSKLAATAVSRSERGIVCLVVRGGDAITVDKYRYLADVETTAPGYDFIADAFLATPNFVYVVTAPTDASFADIRAELDGIGFNWLACDDTTITSDIVSYIKSRNLASKGKKVKAVVYNATPVPNDQHIVNFTTASLKKAGADEAVDGDTYTARIAGILAALPFTRSCTYYKLDDLAWVEEPSDVDAAINAGKLVLINNYGEPMIARGVNSLTTLSSGVTSEFQKITIVEAMDMILEDIYSTFRDSYIGKFKNKVDNQYLFIAAVNGYFSQLTKEDVLDPSFENIAEIDVDTQRASWLAEGKSEAADWDETTVKNMTFKSNIYLKGSIKILDRTL